MNRTQMLLIQLMEECDEVSQRAAKALRFGLDETQDGQPQTNSQRLAGELNDLLATVDLLVEEDALPAERVTDPIAIRNKKLKVEQYLKYSQQCGTLEVLS